ncbi:hypothetical protein PCE1_004646 [Barthelona sp. PCE]
MTKDRFDLKPHDKANRSEEESTNGAIARRKRKAVDVATSEGPSSKQQNVSTVVYGPTGGRDVVDGPIDDVAPDLLASARYDYDLDEQGVHVRIGYYDPYRFTNGLVCLLSGDSISDLRNMFNTFVSDPTMGRNVMYYAEFARYHDQFVFERDYVHPALVCIDHFRKDKSFQDLSLPMITSIIYRFFNDDSKFTVTKPVTAPDYTGFNIKIANGKSSNYKFSIRCGTGVDKYLHVNINHNGKDFVIPVVKGSFDMYLKLVDHRLEFDFAYLFQTLSVLRILSPPKTRMPTSSFFELFHKMPSHYNPDEDVTPHSVDERMHAGYLYLALNTIRYLVLHPVDVHYNLDDEDTTPCIGTSDSFIIVTESRDDEDEDEVLHTSESRIHLRSALLTLSTGNLMYLFDKIPRNTDCIIPKCCCHPPPVLFPACSVSGTVFFPNPRDIEKYKMARSGAVMLPYFSISMTK